MKRYILFLIMAIVLISCPSPNRRSQHTFSTPEGNRKNCFEPPPDILYSKLAAEVDASLPKIVDILKGQMSIEATYQRVREEIPNVQAFEVLHFRLCTDYADGVIDKETYQRFLESILPRFQESTNKESHSSSSKNGQLQKNPYSDNYSKALNLKSSPFKLVLNPGVRKVCPGPDGNDIYYFGKSDHFRLILIPAKNIPANFKPSNLIVHIEKLGEIKATFSKKAKDEYHSDEIGFDFIDYGVETGPVALTVSYGDEWALSKIITIDAVSPSAPRNVRRVKRDDGFYLIWDEPYTNIKEYRLYRKGIIGWEPLASSLTVPKTFLGEICHGYFKIVTYDCAFNKSELKKSFPPCQAPPAPTNLQALERTRNSFLLRWDRNSSDSETKFIVEKWDAIHDRWDAISKKLESTEFRVISNPEGLFRATSINWANLYNHSETIRITISTFRINENDEASCIISRMATNRLTSEDLPLRISDVTPDFEIKIISEIYSKGDLYGLQKYRAKCSMHIINRHDDTQPLLITEPSDPFFYGDDREKALTGTGDNAFSSKIAEPMVEELLKKIHLILKL